MWGGGAARRGPRGRRAAFEDSARDRAFCFFRETRESPNSQVEAGERLGAAAAGGVGGGIEGVIVTGRETRYDAPVAVGVGGCGRRQAGTFKFGSDESTEFEGVGDDTRTQIKKRKKQKPIKN